MANGRKRLFAAFAASLSLAASGLPAAPASAQASGEGGDGLLIGQPCNPVVGGSYLGAACCYFPGQGWVYYYNIVGGGYCDGIYYYEAPEEPADRPSEEGTESPGQ